MANRPRTHNLDTIASKWSLAVSSDRLCAGGDSFAGSPDPATRAP